MTRLLFILILLLPLCALRADAASPDVERYSDIDSLKAELTSRPLHLSEGIWRFP